MMKKIALSIILSSLIVFSCSKESVLELLPQMSATIDGEDWKTVARTTVLTNNKFVITGTTLGEESLAITVFGSTEGIYELNIEKQTCAAVYKKSLTTSSEDAFGSITGKVEITEINTEDKKVSGTFEFQLRRDITSEAIVVSNGVFTNLKYTENPMDQQ